MGLLQHLRSIHEYNVRTLKRSPLSELSGSLGDLGTLLPLMTAMAINGSIDLSSTLVFSGITNIITGVIFGVPLPVQPMKAIASVAISQKFDIQETAAAGLTMGIAVFALSATGLLKWLNRVVPVPVVKGIQVGAGLALVISAGNTMILPLDWTRPAYDNRIWSIVAFVLLVVAALLTWLPYALVVFLVGIVVAVIVGSNGEVSGSNGANLGNLHPNGLWRPSVFWPSGQAWRTGAIDAAIPQLPLTTLNSILAVTSLAAALFPDYPPTPSTTAIGFSVAISNLIGCWFGAMPICHGSGGLAGQYRFGARSGASIILLGLVKLVLGLFGGSGIVLLLQRFPKALLGIMVFAAGVELAKVGQSMGENRDLWEQAEMDRGDGDAPLRSKEDVEKQSKERWTVMLITAAGCLAFKNDAVGFLAGLVWHWTLRVPGWVERMRQADGRIRLQHDQQAGESHGFLDIRQER